MSLSAWWKRWKSASSPEEDELEAQRQLMPKESALLATEPIRRSNGGAGEVTINSSMRRASLVHAGGLSSVDAADAAVQNSVPERRAYIAERAQRFLPSGTVIRQIFGAQRAFPVPLTLIRVIVTPLMGWRVVAVADDAIYVLDATFWLSWRPTRLLRKLPRATHFGPMSGIWHSIQLGSEKVWISMRFFDDVTASDTFLDTPRWHLTSSASGTDARE
jgi:hypothetical protein